MTDGGVQICCFYPGAKSVSVKAKKPKALYEMKRLDDNGFFGVLVDKEELFKYTYVITNEDDSVWEQEDTYAYLPVLSDFDMALFAQGVHYNIYEV